MESAHKQILFTGFNASKKQTSECSEQLSFFNSSHRENKYCMCALSMEVYFYFMHTEFFFTDQHISKIGSHLLSSIVNYYVSSL